MQEPRPAFGVNLPRGHCVQDLLPKVRVLLVPGGQAKQSVDFRTSLYIPALHLVHKDTAPTLFDPASHSLQEEEPVTPWAVPGMHGMQNVLPSIGA